MGEQTLYQASADWMTSAVAALQAAGVQVIAPTEVEPGIVDLSPVGSGQTVVTDFRNVRLPLKRLFLPITEVLLDFEKTPDGDVDVQPAPLPSEDEVVVLGCRPCDAASMEALDKVFQWDYDDVRYRARRERTTLVTLACTQPAPECFCTSVGGSPHGVAQSDAIVFRNDDGGALIQVHTAKGRKFVERLGDSVRPAGEDAKPPAPPALELKFDPEKVKPWLDENFENDYWKEMSLRCLGCGACSCLCPTCHCFDIVDESAWNRGQRRRNWDCCSAALFTLHASGHNPRPDQSARCRQRLMHKFKYFPERFGPIACVGCGRCVTACNVGQDVTRILAEIQSK